MTARTHVAGTLAGTAMLVAMLAACGGEPEASSASPPSPTMTVLASTPEAAPSGTPEVGTERDTSVFDLEVGDCFTAADETVESVGVVGCEEPHVYEVFGIIEHEAASDEPYPGDEELLRYADTSCQPLFDEYVRIDYQSSIYWITSVTPSAETWEAGDREIVCTLKLGEEGDETTGSAEGSGD